MKRILISLTLGISLSSLANADLKTWKALASTIEGNVKAANNYGKGYTVKGKQGVVFDYGDLSNGNKGVAGVGASIEYLFRLKGSSGAVVLGRLKGYHDEDFVVRLCQRSEDKLVKQFGISVPKVVDSYFAEAPSIFGEDSHVVIVNRPDGRCEIFINGVSKGVDDRDKTWVISGGLGNLGVKSAAARGVSNGVIYGVASYKRALTLAEIKKLHDRFLGDKKSPRKVLIQVGGVGVALDEKDMK